MDRIDLESLCLGCPLFAHELLRRQAVQSLEPAGEVVGIDEVGEVLAQLCVIVVMDAFDSGFLDGPVHALDLSVGPGMLDLRQAMFDAMRLADPSEDVLEGIPVGAAVGELDAVVGEHRMQGVRHCLDHVAQELRCRPSCRPRNGAR